MVSEDIMKLGILVNSDNNIDAVTGITRAAVARGHEVTLFTMDEGVLLFREESFSELCGLDGVRMSFCDHSSKQLKVGVDSMTDEIICGSQFDNANMLHDADKVIVL